MVSFLISGLIPVLQQPGLMPGMEEERQELLQLFTDILLGLPDAERRAVYDKYVETWLMYLKTAAYGVADIVDEFRYATFRAEAETGRHQRGNQVKTSSLSLCKIISGMRLPFKGGMRERLRKIMKRIRELVEWSTDENFITRQGQGLMPCAEGQQDSTLSSLKEIDDIILGRDEEKEQIVLQLLDLSPAVGDTISVLPIVGLEAIGKSTLARFICGDAQIKDNFEVILWVDVGYKFNIARIAKSVIDQVIGKDCCLSEGDNDLLRRRIYQELSGKRYLLVLDDVWNDDKEKWEQLKSWLQQSAATGSSLIVTTRFGSIAADVSSVNTYKLLPLRNDDLWTLFCRRALIADKEICPEVREISQQILERCHGSPLLVNLMGGLMRFKKELAEWQEIIHQMENYNSKYDDPMWQIIELCIYHLSSEIKECFAFCSLFSESHYMDKEVLVKLWMANGLISSNELTSVEEKGNRIFNELALRHFFEDVKLVPRSSSKDKHGYHSRVICKMHRIIRDLARQVSQNEYAVQPEYRYHGGTSSLQIRYLSIPGDSSDKKEQCYLLLDKYPHVRTMIYPDDPFIRTIFYSMLPKSNSLRALHLHSALFHNCLFELKYAKHLRYLDLSGSRIKRLPKSTSTLYFLQTLNLSKCLLLCRLPEDMRYMRSLRHLYVDECPKLKKMPVHLGQLSCLKTLTTYIVGESAGNSIDEIKSLDLGGLLEIYNLHKVKKVEISKEAEGREGREEGANCGDARGAHGREANCESAQEGVTSSSTPFYTPRVTPNSTPPTTTEDEVELDTDTDASEQEDKPFYTPQQSVYSDVGGDIEADFGSTDLGENLYLFSKTNLDRLTLCWGRQQLVMSKESNDSKVLEALRPHSGLKVLKIQQYRGHEFANWLADPVGLPNLVELHLIGCSQCMTIPAVWKLRSLLVLCLKHMSNLTCMSSFTSFPGIDEKGRSELFPSLKRLVLVDLKRLERWHEGEAMQRTILSFPVLNEMEITDCPELKTMPSIPVLKYLTISIENHGQLRSAIDLITQSESLVEVNMAKASGFDNEALSALGVEVDKRNSHKLRVMRLHSTNSFFMDRVTSLLRLGFWRSLVSLENLDIFNCSSIVAWPLEEFRNLDKLKRLSVRMCPNLTGLLPSQFQEDIKLLPLLQSLEFYRCLSLKEVPRCSSILYLELDECPEVESISGLNNLKMLFLSCTSWTSLPTGFQDLKKLESLRVSECYSLTCLPVELARLTSLQTVIINKCPRVKSLTEGLEQMLSHLAKFQISECPALQKFCDEGSYSSIISQIGKMRNNTAGPSTDAGSSLTGLALDDIPSLDMSEALDDFPSLDMLFN